jgi:hypothetical protein
MRGTQRDDAVVELGAQPHLHRARCLVGDPRAQPLDQAAGEDQRGGERGGEDESDRATRP